MCHAPCPLLHALWYPVGPKSVHGVMCRGAMWWFFIFFYSIFFRVLIVSFISFTCETLSNNFAEQVGSKLVWYDVGLVRLNEIWHDAIWFGMA